MHEKQKVGTYRSYPVIGPNGVDVGGVLFDVVFLDGSCVSLFGGCDDPTDFAFQDSATAAIAAQALLNQVFSVGNFDTIPALTRGCFETSGCNTLVPYALTPNALNVITQAAVNLPGSGDFVAIDNTRGINNNLTTSTNLGSFDTYAVFSSATIPNPNPTPTPEPATLFLLLLAFVCMSWHMRRKA